MRKTTISRDGSFEWDEDKGRINKKLYGLYSDEILSAFDDPYILELYDEAHSGFAETRFEGLAELQDFIIPYLSYTKPVRQPERDNSCLTTCL